MLKALKRLMKRISPRGRSDTTADEQGPRRRLPPRLRARNADFNASVAASGRRTAPPLTVKLRRARNPSRLATPTSRPRPRGARTRLARKQACTRERAEAVRRRPPGGPPRTAPSPDSCA